MLGAVLWMSIGVATALVLALEAISGPDGHADAMATLGLLVVCGAGLAIAFTANACTGL